MTRPDDTPPAPIKDEASVPGEVRELTAAQLDRLRQIAREPDGRTWTGILAPYSIIALQDAGMIVCLGFEPGSKEPGRNLADGVIWEITEAGRLRTNLTTGAD